MIGFLLVPLSYVLLVTHTASGSDFTAFALAVVISGAGFACLFSPIANVLVRSLPAEVRAEGIGNFKIVLLLGDPSLLRLLPSSTTTAGPGIKRCSRARPR